MLDTTLPAHLTTRLRALLDFRTSGLDEAAVEEVRSARAELAGEVLTSAILQELSHPTASGGAIRAIHLAAELQLAPVVPALVRCLELPDAHPLRHAALAALSRFGAAPVEPLLAALDDGGATEGRAREGLAEALARIPSDDARIRAALIRMLDDDPATAARLLAERGEWRAVAHLSRAVDRLLVAPVGDCDLCNREHLTAIATAVRRLGGSLSYEQSARIDEALERSDSGFLRGGGPGGCARTARRAIRAQRAMPLR